MAVVAGETYEVTSNHIRSGWRKDVAKPCLEFLSVHWHPAQGIFTRLKCCFTSAETVGRCIRDGSPGRPPRLSHTSWALRPRYVRGFSMWPEMR